ncbi:hypothetical protein NV379_14940 [Paenibacillus sp. N1-5-1-14]|nr:hypothetical protein [Paenibacillus radicibacter]MCR8643949.1 hypothetical protein [Paenibacillus radicibacter]
MNDSFKQSLGIVIGLVIVAAVMASKWLIGNMFVSLLKDIFN